MLAGLKIVTSGSMFSTSNVISCNLSPFLYPSNPLFCQRLNRTSYTSLHKASTDFSAFVRPYLFGASLNLLCTKPALKICRSFLDHQDSEGQREKPEESLKKEFVDNGNGGDWTTSILLFVLWGALVYYVVNLAPNQTPSRDMYFLEKLLNLKGDDGFRMNEVLVSLWYIMGLWPMVYCMLLLPTGRSSKSKIPVWPFLVLSFFGGAYALLPYFVIWKPPSPPTEESELGAWPLNFLESKITAAILLAGGLGLITYAALANADAWKEFYQYFRESKFIHVTCLDFSILTAFAPFWVYNDMTERKWFEKGFWLLPASLVPFLGPALYLVLRPSISMRSTPTISDAK